MIDWFVTTLRDNPALSIFLVLGIGFWVGRLKYKTFSLGVVTSVLLVGVVVGQLDIPISGPLKQVFFLLFLFAIGYSVGPQFFRSLRGSGLKQVLFACVICLLCLLSTWVVALILGYNAGEAVGLFAGAQTISAVIGVGTDTLNNMNLSDEVKHSMFDMMPVCYAVTYVYGTIGSAYLLGTVGPMLLGGLKKVKEQTRELEKTLNQSTAASDPAYINALRPVVFRAYKATAEFFKDGATVDAIEQHLASLGRRVFVERVRCAGAIAPPSPDTVINLGDEIVLSGRREYVIQDESWIGPEVADADLLNFPAESVPVMVTKKSVDGMTVDDLRQAPYMRGVIIKSIIRSGFEIPVLAKTVLQRGDLVTIVGLQREVDAAAPKIGYVDRPTINTDLITVGIAIFIGGIIGVLTIHAGGVPISLSTSGGALIAGLVFGWLRSRHPRFGFIPQQSLWLMNNLGLNMFIAVVGITAGPTFISGIREVGFSLFIGGIFATSIPLILAVLLGRYIFRFPAPINLGCCAGGRTTTAALGAVQDSLDSTLPAMGYTVTYAVGNTLLILMGVGIVLLMA